MPALSDRQQAMLDQVEAEGWMFVRGPRLRTAVSLRRQGLIEIGSRHHETGEPVPAWSKGWSNTAERLNPPDLHLSLAEWRRKHTSAMKASTYARLRREAGIVR